MERTPPAKRNAAAAGAGEQPLGRVRNGHGNTGSSGAEGVRRGSVIGTYLHGPLLPKNAWFADWLIRTALGLDAGLRRLAAQTKTACGTRCSAPFGTIVERGGIASSRRVGPARGDQRSSAARVISCETSRSENGSRQRNEAQTTLKRNAGKPAGGQRGRGDAGCLSRRTHLPRPSCRTRRGFEQPPLELDIGRDGGCPRCRPVPLNLWEQWAVDHLLPGHFER